MFVFNLLWRYNEQIIKNIVFQLSFYWRKKSNILNTWTWCFNTITDQHVNCFERLWNMKMSMYWIDFESTCIVIVNTMFENMVDKKLYYNVTKHQTLFWAPFEFTEPIHIGARSETYLEINVSWSFT